MREIMLTNYGAARFETEQADRFFGRSAVATLGSASLVTCGYGASSLAEFAEAKFVRLKFAFSGAGRTTIAGRQFDVSPQHYCVTPADRPCKFEFGPDYQQILIRIDHAALERKLIGLLGARPRGKLEFASDLKRSRKLDSFKNFIRFVAGELSASAIGEQHFLLKEFEETLSVAFLNAVPSSFSELLDSEPRTDKLTSVRRVEDYIDAHWQQPISVEKLAAVTGIGVRTIFATFKRERGYTPLAYLKTVRLKKSHELLQSPATTTSVTSVALACGFSNLGHFARDYQQAFGELPSQTLARARRFN
jgi:AraC-like DNA-binding protein